MKRATILGITVACIAVGIPLSGSTAESPADLQKTLAELLPGMSAASVPDRQEPQQQWQDICYKLGAPGNESKCEEACRLMADQLGTSTPAPARIWLLRQLQQIGGPECVDAVAKCLDAEDENIRDAARRALAGIPAAEANAALLAAMQSADGPAKVGLINSLGLRADASSAAALAGELGSADRSVASAAARALGKIGTPEAANALGAVRHKAKGDFRFRVSDACLMCADKMLNAGDTDRALEIYRELSLAGESRPARLAALRGTIHASGAAAGPTIITMLARDDAAAAVAAGEIGNLKGKALRSLAERFSDLPAAGKVSLIGVLVDDLHPSAQPLALEAVKSADGDVKLAGLSALGRVGDASVVPLLIGAMFDNDEAALAAEGSLVSLGGEGVDEKIVAAMKAAQDASRRGRLIELIESRQAVVAVPALLVETLDDDVNVRTKAMRTLGQLAEPEHVAGMVQGMLKADKGRERDDAEKAVAAVCQKISDKNKQADPVLEALASAGRDERVAMLPALGRIGGRAALEAIDTALNSEDPAEYEAAIRSICNWPNADVAERLLELAQSARERNHQVWALRACVRVIVLPSKRKDAEKLDVLTRAMEMSTQDSERKLVIERLAAVRQIETLRLVVPYLDNPALAETACRTVVELAHHHVLRDPNKAEFDKALDKVIATSTNSGLVDRAKGYKQGL